MFMQVPNEGYCVMQEGPAAAANGAAAKDEAEEPPAKKAKTVRCGASAWKLFFKRACIVMVTPWAASG